MQEEVECTGTEPPPTDGATIPCVQRGAGEERNNRYEKAARWAKEKKCRVALDWSGPSGEWPVGNLQWSLPPFTDAGEERDQESFPFSPISFLATALLRPWDRRELAFASARKMCTALPKEKSFAPPRISLCLPTRQGTFRCCS
jgi:hypothetical protein